MVITVSCPSCGASFPVDSNKIPEAGVNARCSSCAFVFRIERPQPVEELAPDVAEAPQAAPVPEHAPEPESEPEPAVGSPEGTPAATTGADATGADDRVTQHEEPETMMGTFEAPSAPEVDETPEAADAGAEPDTPVDDLPSFTEEPSPEEPVAADEPAAVEAEAPEAPAQPIQGFTFGKRDPKEKARRLARVLVSDMIMYHPDRHAQALANGTLKEDFEEEIEKSWKEYVEQVGEELAEGEGREFWRAALNDVLAQGQQIF